MHGRTEAVGQASAVGASRRTLVWDLPTRLFHWMLVVSVGVCIGTGLSHHMTWHLRTGYAALALVLFRLIWGFLGSESARFACFLRAPATALAHLRGFMRAEPDHEAGHNPAGGWMVLVLLLIVLAEAVSGLGANDGVMTGGPLADTVGDAWSDRLTHWHTAILKPLLLAAIGVHVLAVLIYFLAKGQDLVLPMITGRKTLPAAVREPAMRSPLLALALFAAVAAAVWYLSTFG
jgi:cytochrome b